MSVDSLSGGGSTFRRDGRIVSGTPLSQHSRQSSTRSLHSGRSSQRSSTPKAAYSNFGNLTSNSARKDNGQGISQRRNSQAVINKYKFHMFSPVDDSQTVMCIPPTNSTQVGFSGKYLRENLVTGEDVVRFNAEGQDCSVFQFDRVINEMFNDYSNAGDK
jgi:hypothetical protein